MGKVTTSSQNNITSPSGNSLAVFVDGATFVNNLSIKNIPTASAGLPSGSVWRNGTVLEIIP